MKKLRFISIVLSLVLFFTVFCPTANIDAAVKLNKTNATMCIGDSLILKLKSTKKKITWSSNNSSIAIVNKNGVVKAKALGKATITAKVGSKKYTCKINVNKDNRTLESFVDYLKGKGLITGKSTYVASEMIGAVDGIKYSDSNIEIYEYDITSDTYKDLCSTLKVHLNDFNIDLDIAAINGKFILFSESKETIKAFKSY